VGPETQEDDVARLVVTEPSALRYLTADDPVRR
jgi:hypothetical protein